MNRKGRDIKYDEQDVLKHFRACLEEFGKITPATYKQYRKGKKDVPGQFTIVSRFGWAEMVRKAGSIPRWGRTDEETINQFRETLLKLGYIPTSDEHTEMNLNPTVNSLISAAGGYKEAIEQAGFEYPHNIGRIKSKQNRICKECLQIFYVTNSNRCPNCYPTN